ncbi:uncharacterized protein ACA1_270480 [Acanthamoeba castellanii str. Neff]|uniref:Uncharacterized protein n=1 Tax=Acanthamoeba castellanii (strain ATCC 30010 / Neff) TaxID=1257118 RepID=L8H4D3_ACACF|nr:uncharacterized protein ACA1_270480 [Acanthamoeba castellanii str. Neff]ELR19563.1 hypothetical protein ACA1_270480 [Acanthamoeba castellanii str. Neff]
MEQPQYNMLHHTHVKKELYLEIGLGMMIWLLLALGLMGNFEGKPKFLHDSLLSGKGLNGLETTRTCPCPFLQSNKQVHNIQDPRWW